MRRVIILAGSLAAFIPVLTHAQEAHVEVDAREVESTTESNAEVAAATHHHNAGVIASGDGDFVLAEQEFRASLAIRFRASTAANHAYALEQLRRFSEAITLYDRLLGLPEVELPSNHDHATLERYRQEARAQQATLRVVVRGADDARIVLDDVTIGTFVEGRAVALPVDPGEHRISAWNGERETRSSLQVRAGEAQEVELRFAPTPADVAAAATQDVDIAEDSSEEQLRADTRSNAVYWILGGVVLIAGAVVLGLALRPTPGEEGALPVWRALNAEP